MVELKPKTIVQTKGQYIDTETLLQCFDAGKINHVDKLECGNGFTTSFLNHPPPDDAINILIAPNKAVVISKEQDYKIKSIAGTETIPTKFFYKGSQDFNFEDAKILVFVADSFLIYKRSLKAIKKRINFILIDEYHSTQTQSIYRRKLVNFIPKLVEIVGNGSAITTITATPLLFSQIDIKIKLLERTPPQRNIVITNKEDKAIERIKTLLSKGEKVILFTNSISIIQKFVSKNQLEANFKIGNTLMSNLVELCEVKNNDRSSFYICSSRGFEGFDIYGEGFNIFFFEDRSKDHSTFFASNLYQAINRTRNGFKYAEYIRLELSKNRNLFLGSNKVNDILKLDKKVLKFVNRTDISSEQKQQKQYKDYNQFVTYTPTENGSFKVAINESLINLEKEKFIFDNQNFFKGEFAGFFKERNINFIDNRTAPKRVNKNNISEQRKREFLMLNKEFIYVNGLFDKDYFLMPIRTPETPDALKNVSKFLRRKNYDGLYKRNHTQLMVLSFLMQDFRFESLLKTIVLDYSKQAYDKHPERTAKEKIKDFKAKARPLLIELLQYFVNDNLFFKKNIVAHRDYNILVELNLSQLEIIAGAVGLSFTEVDVRNCFPRILYALNNLELPTNFYGVNKENKTKINVLINNFMYQPKNLNSIKDQKYKAKQNLLDAGINTKVVDYLIKYFFESKFRGNLFNYLSYFESKLIQKLKNELQESKIKSIFRRHDSVLIFDTNFSKEMYLQDFEFLEQKSWFLEPINEAEFLPESECVF